MGSTGSSNDAFQGALGKKSSTNTGLTAIQEAIDNNSINPNYNSGDSKYRTNCALCATAVALKAMGYDVEAMPRDTTWRGYDTIFDVDYTNPDNYIYSGAQGFKYIGMPTKQQIVHGNGGGKITYSDIPTMPKGANQASKAIIDKVQSWGKGAVGILRVKWKGTSSAHAVNVINTGHNVVIYDAQCNKVYGDIKGYLKNTIAYKTVLLRMDNATITKNLHMGDVNKMVKKSTAKKKQK